MNVHLWSAHARRTSPKDIVVDLAIEQVISEALEPLAEFERERKQ